MSHKTIIRKIQSFIYQENYVFWQHTKGNRSEKRIYIQDSLEKGCVGRLGLKHSPMLERDNPIKQIPAMISNLRDGMGMIVTILGEPGIGKTRLAQEMMNIAAEHRCKVLYSRSHSVGRDTAYTPIIEMINQVFRDADTEKVNAWTKELPDLGILLRRVQLPEQPKVADPALEKIRLFESLVGLVERMADGHPLVIVQDDLHYADPASLEFLHYLCRGMSTFPLLLILTADLFELSAGPHINDFIQSLRREEYFREFHLDRLSEQGVSRLLSERLGAPAPDGLLPLMMVHAEGVPLFIDELLHTLLETHSLSNHDGVWTLSVHSIDTIPYRMKELMKDRTRRIHDSDRKVLLYAALPKGTVSHTILHRLSSVNEDDFLSSIQRLIAAGLLYEETQGMEVHYGIYHSLVREVIHEEFPIMTRRRAYASFIDVLEECGGGNVAYMADLYYGAGTEAEPARTLHVFMEEAERSQALHAYSSSVKYYTSALQIIQTSKVPEARTHIPYLLKRLGEAHKMLGRRSDAARYCLEAIRTYVQYDNQQEIARLHRLLSVIYWDSGQVEDSLRYLEDGLTISRKLPDSPEIRYELLHTGLTYLSSLKRTEEYCQVYEEIQEVHKLVGTPQAAARAKLAEIDYWTSYVSKNHYMPNKVQRLIEELEQVATEDETLFRGYFVSSINFIVCGLYDLSRTYSVKALEVAQRMHIAEYEIRSYWIQVLADLLSGQWKLAIPKIDRSMSKARRIDTGRPLAYACITKGIVHAWTGKFADARVCLDEIKRALPAYPTKDGHVMDMMAPIEMMVALGEDRAADYYASMNCIKPHYVALPSLNTALWAEIQCSAGDLAGALDTAKELLAGNQEQNQYASAMGKRLYGKVELALGNREAALALIKEAADSFTALAMPLEQARSMMIYSEIMEIHHAEEAKETLLQCMEVFEQLDSEYDLLQTQELLKKLGIRPASRHTSGTRRQESELSRRELEVARLVTEGLTNNEIAEALFISPRTVSTHLEKIYRRLGIGSKAALVKYMMESR